jgi:predicted DsbA family dithiol-disulfide isomerase
MARGRNLEQIMFTKVERTDNPATVLHWYDFICPFCYVGQQRNAILVGQGFHVADLAFQAHPEIPRGGVPVGTRSGLMYSTLEREAQEAGLPLHWPPRLPNSRRALAAAEWVRHQQPSAFPQIYSELFEAHFALGEDLEDPGVINFHAGRSGVDLPALNSALDDGSAERLVIETEMLGRKQGVQGTPSWLLNRQLITGLRPAVEFERLAEQVSQAPSRRLLAAAN